MPWRRRSQHAQTRSDSEDQGFNAFLSYPHQDSETVSWLFRLLTSYWVPAYPGRRIFLDRQRLTAAALETQIVEALRCSQYLIICWSEAAARSGWVRRELEVFLQHHPPKRVLICRVGQASERPVPLPKWLQDPFGKREQYVPDLSGPPPSSRTRNARKRLREEALSLLAPLLGLEDRQEVLALRARRQRRVALASLILLLLISIGVAWRSWWLTTPDGGFFQLVRHLEAQIEDGQVLDEPVELIPTARALGRLDERDELDRLSALASDPNFHAWFLAVGYVSLPSPLCSRAKTVLETIEPEQRASDPAVSLLVETRCTLPGRVETGDGVSLPVDPSSRVSVLIESGLYDRAEEMLVGWSGLPEELLPLIVEFATGSGESSAADLQAAVRAWRAETDAYSGLGYSVGWLTQLDLSCRLDLPLVESLLRLGEQAASRVPDEKGDAWSLNQQRAALLAGSGRAAEARDLLASTDPQVWEWGWLTDEAGIGWAWRGLAEHRLGNTEQGRRGFDRAWEIASRPPRTSRTYSEWRPLALTAVLAGDWSRAFETVDGPRDGRAKVEQGLYLIRLWEKRRPRWGCQASTALDATSR